MKTFFGLLFASTCLGLHGCANDTEGSDITELEGIWLSSACFGPVPSLVGSESSYTKYARAFEGNFFDFLVYQYNDADCASFKSKYTLEETGLNYNGKLSWPFTFKIGNAVTAQDGSSVRQIDIIGADGLVYRDIYQLNNNPSKLYFGVEFCGVGQTCTVGWPSEIDYAENYVKQDTLN